MQFIRLTFVNVTREYTVVPLKSQEPPLLASGVNAARYP